MLTVLAILGDILILALTYFVGFAHGYANMWVKVKTQVFDAWIEALADTPADATTETRCRDFAATWNLFAKCGTADAETLSDITYRSQPYEASQAAFVDNMLSEMNSLTKTHPSSTTSTTPSNKPKGDIT